MTKRCLSQRQILRWATELWASCPMLRCRERRLKPDEIFVHVSGVISVELCSNCFLKLTAAVGEHSGETAPKSPKPGSRQAQNSPMAAKSSSRNAIGHLVVS